MARNGTDYTLKKKEKFLKALAEGHSISAAAKEAKIERRTVYNWRESDADFAADWDAAIEAGTDALEDEARRRAHDGTLKPVFYQGEEVGAVREYSDTLLIVLLKARRPQKYKERFDVNLSEKTDEELLAIVTQGRAGGTGAS